MHPDSVEVTVHQAGEELKQPRIDPTGSALQAMMLTLACRLSRRGPAGRAVAQRDQLPLRSCPPTPTPRSVTLHPCEACRLQ